MLGMAYLLVVGVIYMGLLTEQRGSMADHLGSRHFHPSLHARIIGRELFIEDSWWRYR